MDETKRMDSDAQDTGSETRSSCPQCSSPGRVVTAVTIKNLGMNPRTVLVTYRCKSPTCLLKYPVSMPETELTDDERALWR